MDGGECSSYFARSFYSASNVEYGLPAHVTPKMRTYLSRIDPGQRAPYSAVLQARALGHLDRHPTYAESLLRRRLYRRLVSPALAANRVDDEDGGTNPPAEGAAGANWSAEDAGRPVTGGIFNLEYSPDGSILAAACERRSFLLFDPGSRRLIRMVENAHSDCVNCVRFLDARSFATCSDDTTVKLWDARYLGQCVRTLHGHSNWVKNIEYSQREGCLLTSGFDGAVYHWDINRYTDEDQQEAHKIFYMNGLMRMRLSTAGDKMVISTMNGFLMVVHDLSLDHLEDDLSGFKPNMYRLMQLSNKLLPVAAKFTHLFKANTKRNRVEFVSDFAPGNDADIISSLRLHPQGWVAVTRNISSDEKSEFCCVHDVHALAIEDDEEDEDKMAEAGDSSPDPPARASRGGLSTLAAFMGAQDDEDRQRSEREENDQGDDQHEGSETDASSNGSLLSFDVLFEGERPPSLRTDQDTDVDSEEEGEEAPPATVETLNEGRVLISSPSRGRVSRRLLGAIIRRRLEQGQRGPRANQPPPPPPAQHGQDRGLMMMNDQIGVAGGQWVYFGGSSSPSASTSRRPYNPPPGRLHRNVSRLTHYLEESNTGKGYIKEVCFSPDGRVICSPFGFGLRLLAFDEKCSDLSECAPKEGDSPKK